MSNTYTAYVMPSDGWYIAFCEEVRVGEWTGPNQGRSA